MQLWCDRYPLVANLIYGSLFLGGGTPSLLSPGQISRLLGAASSTFTFSEDPEITIEVNPGTVNRETLHGYREAGVNRLSIGVQSFLPQELERLDRIHTPEEAHQCVEWARQVGFENLNLDLIFALPGQRFEQWAFNLAQAVSLRPTHVSAYNLTIAGGTLLARQIERGRLKPCSESLQRQMFLHSIDFLESHGYRQYEVSNFARPGYECHHHLAYWNGSPYLGLGASAHSYLGGRRLWNTANLHPYRQSIQRGVLPMETEGVLTPAQAMFETVFLGLRQRTGLPVYDFEQRFGIPLTRAYGEVLSRLFPEGFNGGQKSKARGKWFEIGDGHLRLTREGLLLADSLCAEFAVPEAPEKGSVNGVGGDREGVEAEITRVVAP